MPILFTVLGALAQPGHAQSTPEPTIQFDTLLEHFRLDPKTHVFKFSGDVTAVFLPPGAEDSIVAQLLRGDEPVARFTFSPMRSRAPFSRLSTRNVEVLTGEKMHSGYVIPGPGDYTLVFTHNDDQEFFRFPFKVISLGGGNIYDPQTYLFPTGPWDRWVHLNYQPSFPEGAVRLVLYRQLRSAEAKRQDVDLGGRITCNGEEVGRLSKNAFIGTNRARLQAYRNDFLHRVGDNLEYLPFSSLAGHSGDCTLTVTLGQETMTFPFELRNGAFVGKAREGGPGKFFLAAE